LKLFRSAFTVPPERDDHYSVQCVGSIETDLTSFDSTARDTRYDDKLGQTIYKHNYEVEVKLRSEEGVLTFRSLANGKQMGSTKIRFEGF